MLDRKIHTTSSAQGVCVGKVLHGMRTASRGSPREVVDPESIIINGLSDQEIRSRWLHFCLHCYNSGLSPVRTRLPETPDPARASEAYSLCLDALVLELHTTLFKGVACIAYNDVSSGTKVVLRLPTRSGSLLLCLICWLTCANNLCNDAK